MYLCQCVRVRTRIVGGERERREKKEVRKRDAGLSLRREEGLVIERGIEGDVGVEERVREEGRWVGGMDEDDEVVGTGRSGSVGVLVDGSSVDDDDDDGEMVGKVRGLSCDSSSVRVASSRTEVRREGPTKETGAVTDISRECSGERAGK